MGSFSDSLVQNIDRVKQEINDKIETYSQDVFRKVIELSPTKPFAKHAKGEFINSWYAMSDDYDTTSVTGTYSYDGMESLNRIAALKDSDTFYGKDGFVSLTNNVSYAANVEYQGWPQTPPYAPVRITINLMANKQGG